MLTVEIVQFCVLSTVSAETPTMLSQSLQPAMNLSLCFLKFFVCWHSKKAKQIWRPTNLTNLSVLAASSITGNSEKGGDFFFEDDHFFGQRSTIFDVIDHYFMAAFTNFGRKLA